MLSYLVRQKRIFMKISVIVPVKDEAANVESLFREIKTSVDGLARIEYEIIFIDDGSTDKTIGILQGLSDHEPSLRVLRHKLNCGQSTAIHSGVLQARHEYIIILDGDGQNDPADIPALIRVFADSPPSDRLGMVIGHRVNRQDSGIRKIASRVANAIRAGLLHDLTPDSGCGLKILPRSLFLRLPFFDHMHRFMPALVIREGFQVRSLSVNHRQRRAGISKYGIHNRLWVGITDLLGVMWLKTRMQKPIIEEITARTEE